jgi:UDP:flavonoid glycosyltransferase YjiC (YdhE family)
MSTKYARVYAKLMAPMNHKTRQGTGRQFSYVNAAQVANRLDEVLGPENWKDSTACSRTATRRSAP